MAAGDGLLLVGMSRGGFDDLEGAPFALPRSRADGGALAGGERSPSAGAWEAEPDVRQVAFSRRPFALRRKLAEVQLLAFVGI